MMFENRQHAGRLLADKLLAMERKGVLAPTAPRSSTEAAPETEAPAAMPETEAAAMVPELGAATAAKQRAMDAGNALVVALPRGGVPVGLEIAKALNLPLDVCVVRKVGAPHQPELAVAAVSEGNEIVINEEIRRSLGLPHSEVERLAGVKRAEVRERVKKFRSGRPALDVAGKTAILVDDGVATGATTRAAVQVLRKRGAGRIILALPVAPIDTAEKFKAEVDELTVLSTPTYFYAVGQFYRDFDQVSDQEVQNYLDQAHQELQTPETTWKKTE